MAKIVESTLIKGVYHAYLQSFQDVRGRFVETYRREWFANAPILGSEMIQGNRSDSAANVLRGLHFHRHQADFWYVPQGLVMVALFDARSGSPTYGKAETFEIGTHDNPLVRDHGVYIPPGVAHGFYAITACTMTYMVDHYYDQNDELGILWSDPALGITWPSASPSLSDRDNQNPKLSEIPASLLPLFRA